MIDVGFYATPWAFKILEPISDPHILYSFHMYEPYAYSKYYGDKNYSYPGIIPIGEVNPRPKKWNKKILLDFLSPVSEWAKQNLIPANKIICGEFGLSRFQDGAEKFLGDQISIYNHQGWHWAFYTFREDDGAHAMDYELGTKKPGQKYWQAIELGKMPGIDVYKRKSKVWNMIQAGLN